MEMVIRPFQLVSVRFVIFHFLYQYLVVVNHSALQVQSLILRHECLMYVLT
ncbi:hypothetical protein [Candidatus Tisiphia endosymbiont of Parasteatoda lunata]|uniref:hypothetical protein n=1 Tax=Candidatus Tisiphia endosymbiont of Parasteatoda lunata TaxID=3066275 RepID=UPI00313E3AA8